jgi:hypothetical protein
MTYDVLTRPILFIPGLLIVCLNSYTFNVAWSGIQDNQSQLVRFAKSGMTHKKAVLVQLQPQLRPKPGYIRGRVIDMTGHPLVDIEFHVQGFPSAKQLEWYGNFEPAIDPQPGYYEIPIEDGAYRVSARFNKAWRDYMPTPECLLVLEDFFTADGKRYNEQLYSDSRLGIVRDFVWKPDLHFLRQCPALGRR